ncbi:MAG: protein phosphatase 2C domain-containing protein [Blautia sp.]|nr:protein phosphatase 2C domain-containing protein [Blautia sp.]MDY5030433.1 protein phosphatase 2C domain-containing protein [Blautia sp.]
MIRFAMESRTGDREYNEDCIQMDKIGKERVYLLADGLGGCGCGDVASQTAVGSVLEYFRNEYRPIGETEADDLEQAMEYAQNAVLEARTTVPGAVRMCSTLVILKMNSEEAQWAHIGDSRLYMFRRKILQGYTIAEQTLDHSVPQMLVNMGNISPEEIRKHPDRNRLLHNLGEDTEKLGCKVSPVVKLRKNDAFLLCSDGFWEYITEEQMLQCLKKADSVQKWLDSMLEIVEKNGTGENMDNYSAVCVQIR